MRHLLIVALCLLPLGVFGQVEKYESSGALSDMPFSEAARAGDLLFISGQVGSDYSGNLVEGGIKAESFQVMRNIRDIVYRRRLTMNDVVKCTVFLADVDHWGDFNEIYQSFFTKPYPARSALGANGLALGAALEVECIAAYPQHSE
jgi:reactive intermediate/imine deaminase